jgi:hypothetical protein
MDMCFSFGEWPYTIVFKFVPKTESHMIDEIAKEAEMLLRELKPELGTLISYSYRGPSSRVVYFDATQHPRVCGNCLNAYVDDELTPENDFSARSVGMAEPGHRIMLQTGCGRPTEIVSEIWNEKHKQWETIAAYAPKYCPECGRELFENKERYYENV